MTLSNSSVIILTTSQTLSLQWLMIHEYPNFKETESYLSYYVRKSVTDVPFWYRSASWTKFFAPVNFSKFCCNNKSTKCTWKACVLKLLHLLSLITPPNALAIAMTLYFRKERVCVTNLGYSKNSEWGILWTVNWELQLNVTFLTNGHVKCIFNVREIRFCCKHLDEYNNFTSICRDSYTNLNNADSRKGNPPAAIDWILNLRFKNFPIHNPWHSFPIIREGIIHTMTSTSMLSAILIN